jgi:protease-4
MIKKFIIGSLCSLGVSFLILLLLLSYSFYQLLRPKAVEIKPNTVLELKLTHDLQEVPSSQNFPLQRPSLYSLRDFIDILKVARQDPRIKGLVVHLEKVSFSGVAQIQELRNAILAFRKKGKFTLVYTDTFGELSSGMGAYYFASSFDEIWMEPLGMLNITGLSVIQPFGRQLLDNLGITPEIETREEFKSAYDFAKEYGLTEPNRLALQAMLDNFLKQMVTAIAQERELSEIAVQESISQAPIFVSAHALKEGLVDKITYKSSLYPYLKKRFGADLNLVEFHKYPLERERPAPSITENKIAVIFGDGMIMREAQRSNYFLGRSSIDIEKVIESLKLVLQDPKIKAVVFRINCPGGSALAADKLWHALKEVKEANKPLIVSMGDTAASGGYWIATPAHKIVANPGTLTGSIGVILGKVSSEKFWESIGIHWEAIQTSPNGTLWSMVYPYTSSQKKLVTAMIDHIYEVFIQKVSQGRGLPLNYVREKAAKGRAWTGEQAFELGLVDALGDMEAAIELAKKEAKLTDAERETAQILYLPKPTSWFEQFSQLLRGELVTSGGVRQVLSAFFLELLHHFHLSLSSQDKTLLAPLPPKLEY